VSKLFHSETGRVTHLQHEELTSSRHARKLFHLPEQTAVGGTLYVLAKSRRDCTAPLRLSVNGHPFALEPRSPYHESLTWFSIVLGSEHLQPGGNVVELWAESAAMDSWMLGVEGGADRPNSSLSLDGGQTWQSERMSIRHNIRGEYVIRLRLDDPALSDPSPPEFTWEPPDCARLTNLREMIPNEIQAMNDQWEQARALAAWVSCQWTYSGDDKSGEVKEYCPWDALTILSWSKSNFGQYQSNPVAFCVHYAVVFVSAATALGLSARAVCGTDHAAEGKGGHFVGEVWIQKWQKWCHLDPMCDLAFVRDGVPLSTEEICADQGDGLLLLIQVGSGLARSDPGRSTALVNAFGAGGPFGQWAVWPRTDFLSHPELTPPAHGVCSYCETDWFWARREDRCDLGMFPHWVSPESLARPPHAGRRLV